MKYDLIIDGVVIPDQTYRGGSEAVSAHEVLKHLAQVTEVDGGGRLFHVGPAGAHVALVHWERVNSVQVRIHPEV